MERKFNSYQSKQDYTFLDYKTIKDLIALGESLDTIEMLYPYYEPYRVFLFAAEFGNISVLKQVLYHVPLHVLDNGLILASQNGHFTIVKLLVDRGADVNAGDGAVMKNAAKLGDLKMLQFLISHGADIDEYYNSIGLIGRQYGHPEINAYLEQLIKGKMQGISKTPKRMKRALKKSIKKSPFKFLKKSKKLPVKRKRSQSPRRKRSRSQNF